MAVLITVDGKQTEVTPKEATFSLKELQGYVGGFIEILHMQNKLMVLNDEGRLRSLPLNAEASRLAGAAVVGPVVVADPAEIE